MSDLCVASTCIATYLTRSKHIPMSFTLCFLFFGDHLYLSAKIFQMNRICVGCECTCVQESYHRAVPRGSGSRR